MALEAGSRLGAHEIVGRLGLMSVKRSYTLGLSRAKTRALMILCLSLGSSASLLAQRSDRGIIGGVVTDAQRGALPGAAVIVRNEATGIGASSQPIMPAPTPALRWSSAPIPSPSASAGLRRSWSPGSSCAPETFRHDVQLEIGEIAESVEVTGGDPSTRPDRTSATESTRSTTTTSRSSPPATSASPSRCSRCSPGTFP